MKPSTSSKAMPEIMPTARPWRLDPVGTHSASSETDRTAELTSGATTRIRAGERLTITPKPRGYLEHWHQVVRSWGRACAKGFGVRAARFETAVHEFAGIIEKAENQTVVEAALLRFAHRMVPSCRIELIAGTVSSGVHVASSEADNVHFERRRSRARTWRWPA